MIIAIDGPSGAGKSTLGKMLAKKLNLLYLDTGAMYRAVARAVDRAGIGFDETEKVAEIAENARIDLVGEPDALKIILDGDDVSIDIRTLGAAQAASIAARSGIRQAAVDSASATAA